MVSFAHIGLSSEVDWLDIIRIQSQGFGEVFDGFLGITTYVEDEPRVSVEVDTQLLRFIVVDAAFY